MTSPYNIIVNPSEEQYLIVHSAANHSPRSIDEYLDQAYFYYEQKQGEKTRWKYMLVLLSLGMCSVGDATEMLSIGYVLSDPTFQQHMLHEDMQRNGALITSSITAGMMVGGLMAGFLEYKQCGRRWIILAGLSISFITGISSAIAPNIQVLATLRFLAGLGVGAIQATQSVFAAELSSPNERGFIVSLVSNFFLVGIICNSLLGFLLFGGSGIAYATDSIVVSKWRVFIALSTVPTLLAFILSWSFLPESPRFSAMVGDYEKAAFNANRIANQIMGWRYPQNLATTIPHAMTSLELSHYYTHLQQQEDQPTTNASTLNNIREVLLQCRAILYQFYNHYSNDVSHSNVRNTHRVRWIAIYLQLLYMALSAGASVNVWMNVILKNIHVGNNIYFDSLLSSFFCIPGAAICSILIDRIGRRKLITSSMAFAGFALLFAAWIVGSSQSYDNNTSTVRTVALVWLVCLYNASMSCSWTVLNVMISESFPTKIRSAAFAICGAAGRLSLIGTQYVNGAWMNRSPSFGALAVLLIGGLQISLGAILSMIVITFYYTHDMTHCPMKDDDEFSEHSAAMTEEDHARYDREFSLPPIPEINRNKTFHL